MKTRIIMMTLALALLGLSACIKDADVDDPVYGALPTNPKFPLMPIPDFEMWPAPSINDNDLQGESYSYDYWKEHKAEAQSFEELIAMTNVPNDLLKNMSTTNLAWTCFKHPYNNNWLTGNNIYYEILVVMTTFNGYEELMKRYSGRDAVVDLYIKLGYKELDDDQEGKTLVSAKNLASWTLVVCTLADNIALNTAQRCRLAKEVLAKNDAIALSQTDDFIGQEFNYLLGALIAYHYDYTLSEEKLVLLKNFIEYICNHGTSTNEDLSRAHNIINGSLAGFAAGDE